MSDRARWSPDKEPFDFDGRPVAETTDSAGSSLPGCEPESHGYRVNGEHSMLCFIGAWSYHRDGEVWRRDPAEPGETLGDVIEHHGTVRVRPVGRGVVAEGPDGADDWDLTRLPEGRYRADIRLERIADE